jgi:hypothetical protein
MSSVAASVWPWVPVGLLAAMLAGLGTMAAIAVNDPGFALERDYYAKAVRYDAEITQRAQNARLGWVLAMSADAAAPHSPSLLTLKVDGAQGPIAGARVRVEAFENARASLVLDAELLQTAPGVYQARLPLRRSGLWEFRFAVVRGAERFTGVVRHDVREAP